MYSLRVLTFLLLVTFACAKVIVVNVGGNTTDDPTKVFDPQVVTAEAGDVVTFTFKQGNHTATQSTFGSPCVPIHDTNTTINGFNSGFRNAGNGTAITTLPVTITNNETIWFFDFNTCALGGVGGINLNSSSENTETIDGFERNAIRLNGTGAESVSTTSKSSTATGSSTNAGGTPSPTSHGHQQFVLGLVAVLPLAFAALLLA